MIIIRELFLNPCFKHYEKFREIWKTFSSIPAPPVLLNGDLWQQEQYDRILMDSNETKSPQKVARTLFCTHEIVLKYFKNNLFQTEDNEIILNHADCEVRWHPKNAEIG